MCHAERAVAWALLSNQAPKHFLSIHRAASSFFRDQPVFRVEAYIDVEFPVVWRWIKALGFTEEKDFLRGYLPGGRHAALWVRFKE